MELNNLKKKAQSVRAPEIALPGFEGASSPLDGLIARLKEQDAKDRKWFRRMKFFFAVAACVYVLIFTIAWIYPPDTDPALNRLLLGIFALVFLSAGLRSALKARRISQIDYSEPVDSFLKNAEHRYRFADPRELWLTLPFIVIASAASGMAWMSAFRRYFPSLEPSVGLISFCSFWVVVCAVGGVIGRRDWKRRRAPILQEIRRLRAELNAEEQGKPDKE